MKSKILVFSVAGLSVFGALTASSLASERFPRKMLCHATQTVAGSQKSIANFGTALLSIQGTRVNWSNPSDADLGVAQGGIDQESGQAKFRFDEEEGDQHFFMTFSSDNLSALANGNLSTIRGEYEDGYDWMNGYNVREKLVLSCVLQ